MANPDDVIPELPPLPPGSDFAFLEGRLHGFFDPLPEADIPRVTRFGERRSYPDGAMLFEVGKEGAGMIVLLSGGWSSAGATRSAENSDSGSVRARVTLSPRCGQLSGALSLLDIQARGPVEGVLLSPESLRTLLVAEVELGDRILRTLTLRRLGLLALGFGGPVLIGSPADARLRTLQEYLLRSGHPAFGPGPGDRQGCCGARRPPCRGPGQSPARGLPGSFGSQEPG